MTGERWGELGIMALVVLALVLYCLYCNGCGPVYQGCPRYQSYYPLDCGACH